MGDIADPLLEDVRTLRALASKVREYSERAETTERRQRWLDHNSLRPGQPLVFAEVGGLLANNEYPVEPMLTCSDGWARDLERGLRDRIYQFEVMHDDWVIEPWINCNWHVNGGSFGVHSERHSGSHDGVMGSFVWEPPLKNVAGDLNKLRPREFSVDREATLRHKKRLEEIFDGTLGVRIRGGYWWTTGLTQQAIDLIGLEQMMLYMIDEPEGLHRLMKFLHDDMVSYSGWLEREGLLTLNNENDYIGSGSVGYTTELPRPGMGDKVRLKDLWVLSESQETVGVGPEMFDEFIFPYQKSVTERFGLSYYGCCEPVHTRWHILRQLGNLRKVSISPWCDQEMMARELGNRYVFCRKPNPALLSMEGFNEELIRADLRATLETTAKHGCLVEVVMKDVHTVRRDPQRLVRWVEIAREEIARIWPV